MLSNIGTPNTSQAFWGSLWLYNLSLTLTKISILVQYYRVFATPRFRICCYVMIGVVVSYGILTFFGSIFICTPVPFFWDKTIPGGKCLNELVVWYLNATVNIITDLAIITMPMPVLRRLKIETSQRKGLMFIFTLGGFVCLISIMRLSTLVKIANSKDPTFDNPPAATFSSVETNIGIICACLPACRPLLALLLPGRNLLPAPSSFRILNLPLDEERPKNVPDTTVGTLTETTTAPSPPPSRPDTATTSLSETRSRAPTTEASTRPNQSRGSSTAPSSNNEVELQELYQHQASVFKTGNRAPGPVRQVTIGSASPSLNSTAAQQAGTSPDPASSDSSSAKSIAPSQRPTLAGGAPTLPALPENIATFGYSANPPPSTAPTPRPLPAVPATRAIPKVPVTQAAPVAFIKPIAPMAPVAPSFQPPPFAPMLPALPGNLSAFGFAEASRPPSSRQSRSRSNSNQSRAAPELPPSRGNASLQHGWRPSRDGSRSSTPVVQKPLPITPFPVIDPWNR